MDANVCRMCGKEKLGSNLEIISTEIMFQINFHCRIELEDDKRLPQKICYECINCIEKFMDFCEEVQNVQKQFKADSSIEIVKTEPLMELPECFVQIDRIDPEVLSNERENKAVNVDAKDEKDFAQKDEEIDYEWENHSSDSDYKKGPTTYRKRKVETPKRESKVKRRRFTKRSQSQKLKDNEMIELEIPETHKNDDGTISINGLSQYNENKWNDIELTCVECLEKFKGPFALKGHYEEHHSPDTKDFNKYKCDDCDESHDAFHKYINHVCECHRVFLKFCCFVCSEMFWSIGPLQQHHQEAHKNVQASNCILCGRYFKTFFYLASHRKRFHNLNSDDEEIAKGTLPIHNVESLFSEELASNEVDLEKAMKIPKEHRNNDGTISKDAIAQIYKNKPTWKCLKMNCSECKKEFPSAFLLSEHYSKQHLNSKTRNFVCTSCLEQKTFFCFESYVNHTLTIHHEHLRFQCIICCEFFWNYKALYNHYKSSHEYRALLCLYCGKLHKCGYDLKCHKEVHLKSEKIDEPREFKCHTCSKSYNTKLQLQRHFETHKHDKSWICETCGVSFKSKSSMTNHYTVHQTEKPFKCDICSEAFKNKYKLKLHKEIHTGEKKWGCEICSRKYRSKGSLKKHVQNHTGERPWKCEHCEKGFAAKYDLMVHTRLHTGDYTHECKICGERYPSWSNYSKHMRGRHKVDPRSEKKKKYDALHKSNPTNLALNTSDSMELNE